MIVALLSNGDFVVGLDAENIRRLTAGEPVVVDLRRFGGQDHVMIMYGATLADIQTELTEAVGPLPTPTPMPLPDEPRRH